VGADTPLIIGCEKDLYELRENNIKKITELLDML